jgi:NAD(P)-dependent dehydrogenase (short-subunit alcohol dehydrogenase family)
MKLENRVALVTGAGGGFGRCIALGMAAEGARICVNDIDPKAIEGTLAALRENGAEGLGLPADVGDSKQVADMFDKLKARWGTVDILVNNAGIGIKKDWTEYKDLYNNSNLKAVNEVMTTGKTQASMMVTSSFKDEWWNDTLQSHLYGTFYCSREALKIMEANGGGKIINMASYCGVSGCPALPAYSAAKGGIISFSKSLAKEVIGSGITVNVVAPGFCETPILDPIDEQLLPVIVAGKPIGRLGTSEEIASLVVYLATDDANFIVGQVISPNGGMWI